MNKKKIITILMSLLFLCGIFFYDKILFVNASNIKTITITFATPPTPSSVTVTKAPLKYNKDFAFSINADDGQKDSYSIFYRAFNGGRIANSDIISKGAYFTDGTGNKIPFRGNFQLTTMNSNIGDSFVPIRNIGNLAYVDWDEAKEVSDKGWDITNHGWSHNGYPVPADRIFPYPEPHGPSTIDYDYEIEQNQLAIEANVGQRPIIMGPPDADPGYDPYIYVDHGLFAKIKKFSSVDRYTVPGIDVAPSLDLNQYNIMGYVYMPSYGSVVEDTPTDIINFVDFINNSSIGGAHFWNRLTMHRFFEAEGLNGLGYQSLKDIIDHIETNYGYLGADNAWIASSQEIYEYLYAKQSSTVTESLVGNTLTLTLDFGDYPSAFKRQSLSLLVDSDATISNVTSLDSGANISFNPTTGLINTDFLFFNNDAFESDCEEKVSIAETSRLQTDFDEADDYVTAMDTSALKTSLRTRLNNVSIFAREWFMSFGLTITSPANIYPVSGVDKIWNGVNGQPIISTPKPLLEATGVDSTLTYTNVDLFPFQSFSSAGAQADPDGSGKYMNSIMAKTAYAPVSGTIPTIIKINNLNSDKLYDIEIFSSKTSAIISTYHVVGSVASANQSLDGYNNISNTVTFNKITPSATNDIQVYVDPGGRLGVLHITERPIIETPVSSIEPGLYNYNQSVILSSLASDYIKYSTTEIPATCSAGTLYTGPILVSTSQTIYVRACDNQDNFSTTSFNYEVDTVPPETPISSHVAGIYDSTQSISLTASGSSYIKYSNNEIPFTCSYGGLYSGPISVSDSQTIYVRACDDAGNSSVASFAYTISNITVPSAPTIGTATAGDTQATITFTAPSSDGGSTITGYTVTSIPSGGVDSNAGETGLSHIVTGLTNGTSYTFTITATNAVGTGPVSSASNAVTPIYTNISYTLNYISGQGGSITGLLTQTILEGNDGSSITALPSSGYKFVKWSDNSTNNPRTDLNIQSDLNISAIFEKISGISSSGSFMSGYGPTFRPQTVVVLPVVLPTTIQIKSLTQNLKLGMSSNDIEILQLFLIEQNKGLNAKALSIYGGTNYFGNVTQSALAEWQKLNGLIPDGIFGPMTRAKIKFLESNLSTTGESTVENTVAPTTTTQVISLRQNLKLGMNNSDVKILQSYLNSKGYDCGNPDGILGIKTDIAIKKFQSDNKLIPDGVVGSKTRGFMK